MTPRANPFAEIAWPHPGSDARGFRPAVDIYEVDDAVVVRVELPGVRPEDVQIDTRARMLTVRGERRPEPTGERRGYHRLERAFGTFSRSFHLPEDVDATAAAAVMEEGILTVRIPKRVMRHAS